MKRRRKLTKEVEEELKPPRLPLLLAVFAEMAIVEPLQSFGAFDEIT